MKDIITNIIFWVVGAIVLTVEFTFKFNDTLGWLLTTIGVILIGIGFIYKSKKPFKYLIEFFINFF
ncbi:hypothetical protein BN000_01060 [Neobacillus massiliamazoniensis]|jgi:hypothetical protein|uniref:Uncharacterized protein n=1 Tax=Neobacillus massiliamazoniensis TaxID=1499688 RepID=A0A0U1NSX4_9BACI|nr:hypothetical protein BN000_01060 [Neobacillus massiliamazoniensis]